MTRSDEHAVGQVRCADDPVGDPSDARGRRRAGRGLAPDGVQRDQQPRPAAPRHPGRGSRSRSTPSATRPTGPRATCAPAPRTSSGCGSGPAQEGTANATMDRFVHSLVETSREAGYHVLLFAGSGSRPTRWRGTTTCCARPPWTPSSSPTPTSATRRRPGCRSAARRSSPSAARGTTRRPRHPWVDVDGAAGTELATRHLLDKGPPPDRVDRLAQGLADRRGPPLRLDPGDARPRAADHRARVAGGGHRRLGPRGQRAPARQRPAVGVRLRLRHPRDGRAAHPARPRAARRASTSPSSASTTPRSRRWCRPA